MFSESIVENYQEAAAAIGMYEIGWLVAITFIATAVGLARASRDREYDRIGNLFALGICSGAAGLVCSCFVAGAFGGIVGAEFFLLGVSTGAALVGKPIEQVIRHKLEQMLGVEDYEKT